MSNFDQKKQTRESGGRRIGVKKLTKDQQEQKKIRDSEVEKDYNAKIQRESNTQALLENIQKIEIANEEARKLLEEQELQRQKDFKAAEDIKEAQKQAK